MKTIKILKWAGITAIACVSTNAFAMGAKGPSEESEIFTTITANQKTIGNLEVQLHEPLDSPPVINEKTTRDDLWAIEAQQQKKIASLTKEAADVAAANLQAEENAEKGGVDQVKNPNLSVNPEEWVEQRCTALGDSLDSNKDIEMGRGQWASKCLRNYEQNIAKQSDDFFKKTGRWDLNLEDEKFLASASIGILDGGAAGEEYRNTRYWYPSFGVSDANGHPINPLGLVAPVHENEDCGISYRGGVAVKTDILADAHYRVVAMCVSGCYTPDQKLLFKDGVQEIGDAFDHKNLEIETLTTDSTLGHPTYQTSELEAYTVDIAPAHQDVIDFETVSGKKLSVTKNHPLLDSNGQMRTAESLKIGESLVLEDGSFDPIIQISHRDYFGKVYNVRPRSAELLENIVVAQGVLSGSVYFQNEGTKDLNRALFRINLPKEIIR
jgi:hypothetical protein